MRTREDDSTIPETSLVRLWSAHRGAILLSAIASLSVLSIVFLAGGGSVAEKTVRAFGAQLLVMSVVLPLAAARAGRAMDLLWRGGAVNDAFGAGLLAVALGTGGLAVREAIQVYLLAAVVGLVCLGVWWWVWTVSRRVWPASVAAAGVALLIWAGLFDATGQRFRPDGLADLSVGQRMVANADLHAAVAASVGVAQSPAPWYAPVLVFAAAAGLVWSGPLITARPARPEDPGDTEAHDEDQQ